MEQGFNADKRSDVKLFYGVRNLDNMAYQINWQWLPFTNSAQKDDLKLYHWVSFCTPKVASLPMDLCMDVIRYIDEEYEKYLTDPFDLRFIVMADRFPSSCIVEELIEWIPVWVCSFQYGSLVEEADKDALVYIYKTAASGFSAKLTPQQLAEISNKPFSLCLFMIYMIF
ncbi:putative peptidase S8 propeptide/proteinase inhibitor I9 [Rosa chinensis]|uniref:Putative peptidase S8 propeptide/proteinase inhibitor I9 n=1 Tax=Rosa chinensis TaxID=74649 RepID=A0A2P6RQU6_ROSCH|nr:putative peptidase S8 propeptide/proteinase inhibitor I9 [Rosa chinensis]